MTTAHDAIDPAKVPRAVLRSGDEMPVVGLGTFGSDAVAHHVVAAALTDACAVGYRHFDCASVYGNEDLIGASLATAMASGVARADLWITSKVWNNMHDSVEASCEQSLRDLQLDYLDLYLVHWPFPNHHSTGADVTERHADATGYVHDAYMATWAQMERLVARGLVRNIGTSNMTIPKLELLLRDAAIAPAANEMELHPHFQQPELFDFVRRNEMLPIGFSPIGSPARPARDRTPEDTAPTSDPVLIEIAERRNMHPATLCVKWAAQRGQVPIPFSTTRRNYLANLQSVTSDPLTADEISAIAAIDRDCRLIKGQVFCWKPGQDWRELWDLDGTIAQ